MGIFPFAIIIAIVGGVICFFNPHIANWFIVGVYLLFTFGLFLKSQTERKNFLAGEAKREGEILAIKMAPIALMIVLFLTLILYLLKMSLIHLLWAVPTLYFIFEHLNAKKITHQIDNSINNKQRMNGGIK